MGSSEYKSRFLGKIMNDSISEENIRSLRKEKRGEKKERMVSRSDISYYASRSKEKGALRRRDGLSGFSGNLKIRIGKI